MLTIDGRERIGSDEDVEYADEVAMMIIKPSSLSTFPLDGLGCVSGTHGKQRVIMGWPSPLVEVRLEVKLPSVGEVKPQPRRER